MRIPYQFWALKRGPNLEATLTGGGCEAWGLGPVGWEFKVLGFQGMEVFGCRVLV